MNAAKVIQIAQSYLGKTEKPANSGFNDAEFEKKMKSVGWLKSQSWCVYFAELVYKEASESSKEIALLNKLFSGSATATFKSFDLDKTYKTGMIPKPGALAIWRYGNGWQGHAGIVEGVTDNTCFKSIEANTNDQGGREGYIVAKKTRYTNNPYNAKGLNLVGFIYLG